MKTRKVLGESSAHNSEQGTLAHSLLVHSSLVKSLSASSSAHSYLSYPVLQT